MGVKDWARNVILAAGLSLGIPSGANAEFNIFDPSTWIKYASEYQPGDVFDQLNRQNEDTTRVDTSRVGTLYSAKVGAGWEKMLKIGQNVGGGQGSRGTELKTLNIKEVNKQIEALHAEVDSGVLDIVLPAWRLSPETKGSLEGLYGTGLTDDKYKALLFWDEYKYAKIKADSICKELGIKYDEVDAKEFAVVYASIATLGYGIGRPNMKIAVDSAILRMKKNVDPTQWTLVRVMQWLPEGITTREGQHVYLDYPKRIISDIYQFYKIDYNVGAPQPLESAATSWQQQPQQQPTPSWQQQPPQQQQPQQQQPPSYSDSVARAISSIDNGIKALNELKTDKYEKSVWYYDPIIAYGKMLCAIATKSSTIDAILLEANGAGLISYFGEVDSGEWKAFLTPSAKSALETDGYSEEEIDSLNSTLQEMADKRNFSAKEFNNKEFKDVAKALERAGIYLLPNGYGGVLDSLLTTKGGGVEAVSDQISNYEYLKKRNMEEINSQYGPQINYLNELKKLVKQYEKETNSLKRDSILEEIGKVEENGIVKFEPSIYEILTGEEYTPKPKEEGNTNVPPADEVLGEQNIPGYSPGPRIPLGPPVTADSVRNMTFQPSNLAYSITVYAYLGTLPVEEHIVYDSSGVEYTATVLTEKEKNAVLEKIAERLNNGKLLNEETIKEAVREATGLSTSMRNDGLQDWKTAFGWRGWKCDGTPKSGTQYTPKRLQRWNA